VRRFHETLESIAQRTPWSPPLIVETSEIVFGLIVFALIVATIVFMPAESYRFFYGQQF